MSLGWDIVSFFHIDNTIKLESGGFQSRAMHDFISAFPVYIGWSNNIKGYCDRLAGMNCLFPGLHTGKLYGETYFSLSPLDPLIKDLGILDFVIFGFPKIYDVCKSGVKPIIIKEANGDFDMGTCFKITGNAIVTARHCVENKNHISIPGWDPLKCRLLNIFVHKYRSIDVAVLLFTANRG